MESKETKYYAIFENGNHVEKQDINSILSMTGYKYIIKKSFHHEYVFNPGYPRYYFRYTAVNDNDKDTPVVFGDFTILDMGIENGQNYYDGTVCKLFDQKKKTVYDILVRQKGIKYLYDKLIPILEKVNELGTWESYQVFLQNEKLMNENKSLMEKVEELKREVETLKTKS